LRSQERLNNRVTIQPLTAADLPDVGSLQPEGWGDILPSIKFYCSSSFCFPLKAVVNGRIAGVGTAINHLDTAWLAHIIVHKDYRNNGIGSAITNALIDVASSLACQTLFLLATELGEPVYKKFGFTIQSRYLFLDEGVSSQTFLNKNVTVYQSRYQDEILHMDRVASGENREKILKLHLADAKLFVMDGQLLGYYLPTLGDGLIISDSPEAGIELMKCRRQINQNFCVPEDNRVAIEFLKSLEYKEKRRAARMILGREIPWDGRRIYNRIGGNLG
jgi:GNAT superfamily N-acetyltransferase